MTAVVTTVTITMETTAVITMETTAASSRLTLNSAPHPWRAERPPQAVGGRVGVHRVVPQPEALEGRRRGSGRRGEVRRPRRVAPPRRGGRRPGHRPGARLDGQAPHGGLRPAVVRRAPLLPAHWSVQRRGAVPQRVALLLEGPAPVVPPHGGADAVGSPPRWVQRVLLHVRGAAGEPVVLT